MQKQDAERIWAIYVESDRLKDQANLIERNIGSLNAEIVRKQAEVEKTEVEVSNLRARSAAKAQEYDAIMAALPKKTTNNPAQDGATN